MAAPGPRSARGASGRQCARFGRDAHRTYCRPTSRRGRAATCIASVARSGAAVPRACTSTSRINAATAARGRRRRHRQADDHRAGRRSPRVRRRGARRGRAVGSGGRARVTARAPPSACALCGISSCGTERAAGGAPRAGRRAGYGRGRPPRVASCSGRARLGRGGTAPARPRSRASDGARRSCRGREGIRARGRADSRTADARAAARCGSRRSELGRSQPPGRRAGRASSPAWRRAAGSCRMRTGPRDRRAAMRHALQRDQDLSRGRR